MWRLAVNRARECARLTAEVRRLTDELGAANADRRALVAHLAEAVKGRERAMAVAKELGGAPRWNEADAEWMRTHGVEPA